MELLDVILNRIRFEPSIDPSRIAVATSSGGHVVLNGVVRTYAEKQRVEEIVRRLRGVTSLQNEIEVRLTIGDYRTDATLERIINELYEAMTGFGESRPLASVRDGWVVLQGSLPSRYQKQLAEGSLRYIAGVRGITNEITVTGRRRSLGVPAPAAS